MILTATAKPISALRAARTVSLYGISCRAAAVHLGASFSAWKTILKILLRSISTATDSTI
ncbi:MAG: hypothetical protein H0X15_07560 [Acidobacteria bacterium]|nr:hypothetical protein [Acidobacteriota bacterium]